MQSPFFGWPFIPPFSGGRLFTFFRVAVYSPFFGWPFIYLFGWPFIPPILGDRLFTLFRVATFWDFRPFSGVFPKRPPLFTQPKNTYYFSSSPYAQAPFLGPLLRKKTLSNTFQKNNYYFSSSPYAQAPFLGPLLRKKHSRAGFSTARMLNNFSNFYSKNNPN